MQLLEELSQENTEKPDLEQYTVGDLLGPSTLLRYTINRIRTPQLG